MNVREKLKQMKDDDILTFTDAPALSSPYLTGAVAVIYMDGYKADPKVLTQLIIDI